MNERTWEELTDNQLRAYALGYYHGKAEGLEDCPYEGYEGQLRHLYRRGYDAGIADYCLEVCDEV